MVSRLLVFALTACLLLGPSVAWQWHYTCDDCKWEDGTVAERAADGGSMPMKCLECAFHFLQDTYSSSEGSTYLNIYHGVNIGSYERSRNVDLDAWLLYVKMLWRIEKAALQARRYFCEEAMEGHSSMEVNGHPIYPQRCTAAEDLFHKARFLRLGAKFGCDDGYHQLAYMLLSSGARGCRKEDVPGGGMPSVDEMLSFLDPTGIWSLVSFMVGDLHYHVCVEPLWLSFASLLECHERYRDHMMYFKHDTIELHSYDLPSEDIFINMDTEVESGLRDFTAFPSASFVAFQMLQMYLFENCNAAKKKEVFESPLWDAFTKSQFEGTPEYNYANEWVQYQKHMEEEFKELQKVIGDGLAEIDPNPSFATAFDIVAGIVPVGDAVETLSNAAKLPSNVGSLISFGVGQLVQGLVHLAVSYFIPEDWNRWSVSECGDLEDLMK